MTKLLIWLLEKWTGEKVTLGKIEPRIVEIPVDVDYGIPPELQTYANLAVKALANVNQSGEWKRHQVYAELIKRFKAVPRRDIALAIELAVRENA